MKWGGAFPVSAQTGSFGVSPPGTPVTAALEQLPPGAFYPARNEHYDWIRIYLPFGAVMTTTSTPPTQLNVQIAITDGSYPLWAYGASIAFASPAANTYTANNVAAEDFTNPIPFPSGRSAYLLTMTASIDQGSTSGFFGVGFMFAGISGQTALGSPSPGAIIYSAISLDDSDYVSGS